MSFQKSETVFDLEKLLGQVTDAFTQSALRLRQESERDPWRQLPYVYHMPKMSVQIQLSLSHSDGRVKGVFSKTRTSQEQQLSSTIQIDVVAVPNPKLPSAKAETE
jgi:hypothetical protein